MDVFISYRRKKGFIYAKTIYDRLKEAGIETFYDIKSLQEYSGEFTQELQNNIQASEFFVLILTCGCFDIPNKEESIFLKEILYAKQQEKTIIPVICEDFSFSEGLFEEVAFLPRLQSVFLTTDRDLENFTTELFAKMAHSNNPRLKKIISVLFAGTVLKNRQIVDRQQSLTEYFTADVVSLDICSFSSQALLRNARAFLELILKHGCKIRIVMNTPGCAAAVEAARLKSTSGTRRQRDRILDDAFEDLQDWISEYPDQIEYRTTELFLPCAIMILKYNDPDKNNIKVDYYSFNCPDKDRRSLLIGSTDLDNFSFYENQFEWIWDHPHITPEDV